MQERLIQKKYKEWLMWGQTLSQNSLYNYVAYNRHFFGFFEVQYPGEEFKELHESYVVHYVAFMKDNGERATTINSRITGLKKFNDFLIEKGYQNKMVVRVGHRVTKTMKPIESEDVIDINEKTDSFFSVLKKHGTNRDIAIALLIYKHKLTAKQIVTLRLEEVLTDAIEFFVKGSGYERFIFDEETKRAINSYKVERVKSLFENSDNFFVTSKSGKMNEKSIYYLFRKYSKLLPFKASVTPKDLLDSVQEEVILSEDTHAGSIEEPSYAEYKLDNQVKIIIQVLPNKFEIEGTAQVKVDVMYHQYSVSSIIIIGNSKRVLEEVEKNKGFVPFGWIITNVLDERVIKDCIVERFYRDNQPSEFLKRVSNYSYNTSF
ncbi:tyrosine-type recombinase/integrase [Rossellomorea aquimaris]|uniref:Core-binding (CB) domain-containing protein n=1 Tax=Rossellomorea aquimaris TaxID=189382 RepID=A0A5D4TNS0_9BACI|nr:site-specific integrase [Rossellomorea aquimaris]TYS76599.1 hypothetical protein FZC80_14950 [Rossellomorea aquimaris]